MVREISVLENMSLIFKINSLRAKSPVKSPAREIRNNVIKMSNKNVLSVSSIEISGFYYYSKYFIFSVRRNCDLTNV